MQIKTKFKINTLFTLIVVFTIGLVIHYTSTLNHTANNNTKVAHEIIQGAFDISLVANHYFLHREDITAQQWKIRHQSLEKLINNVNFESLEQQSLLQELTLRHKRLNTIFLQLLKNDLRNKGRDDNVISLESRLISRFMENSHIMASTAHHLSNILKSIADNTQQTSNNIVLFLIVLMGAVIAYLSKALSNSIIPQILLLQDGVKNISEGNLSHEIPIYKPRTSKNAIQIPAETDELVELGKAFNLMATQLSTQHNELALREKNLSITINNIVDAIITISGTGIILSFNNAAIKIFGYEKQEVIGQNISTLMPEAFSESHDSYLQSFLHTGEAKVIGTGRTVEGLHKNSRVFPMRLTVAELPPNEDGERRFVGSCQDITDITHKEEQLRRSQKMDAIGQLTGGVAHDFNNILAIILSNTELVQHLASDNDAAQERLQVIIKSTTRAAELTKKLLSFSTFHQSTQVTADINKVIIGLETLLVRSITPEVELNNHLSPQVWPTQINTGDLEDSLLNLILNARDAMQNGGAITVETKNTYLDDAFCQLNTDAVPGDYVEIIISDNGSGIKPDDLVHIFEPFYTTKDKDKGTGLGLSMVYGFIARSNGYIKVYSEVNIGTTFRLYLPKATTEEDSPSQTTEKLSSYPTGYETILVVDDEAELLNVTQVFLQTLGYDVLTATNGKQALNILEKNKIDVLFSDVVMPGGINGYDVTEQAVKIIPNIKYLLTSGYTNKAIANTNQMKFSSDLLTKPYTHSDLANRIRNLLD